MHVKLNNAHAVSGTYEDGHVTAVLRRCSVLLGRHNGSPNLSTPNALANAGLTNMWPLPVGVHAWRRHGHVVSTFLAEEVVQERVPGSV